MILATNKDIDWQKKLNAYQRRCYKTAMRLCNEYATSVDHMKECRSKAHQLAKDKFMAALSD